METGLIIGTSVEFGAGLLCIILGLIIWKKQKISFVHEYQYRNVKEADKPAYCRGIGIGLIVIGAGILLTGIGNLIFKSDLTLITLFAGLIVGTVIMHKAQKKYNGSWFS